MSPSTTLRTRIARLEAVQSVQAAGEIPTHIRALPDDELNTRLREMGDAYFAAWPPDPRESVDDEIEAMNARNAVTLGIDVSGLAPPEIWQLIRPPAAKACTFPDQGAAT